VYKFKVAHKMSDDEARAALMRALHVDQRDLPILLFFTTNLKKYLLSAHRLWEKIVTA
jgi:hypothetical protein